MYFSLQVVYLFVIIIHLVTAYIGGQHRYCQLACQISYKCYISVTLDNCA